MENYVFYADLYTRVTFGRINTFFHLAKSHVIDRVPDFLSIP